MSLEDIHKAVCSYFNLDRNSLLLKTRKREIAYPRQLFQYLSYEYNNNVSLNNIGSYLSDETGHRYHHATVLHSIKLINNFLEFDKSVKNDVNQIKKMIET